MTIRNRRKSVPIVIPKRTQHAELRSVKVGSVVQFYQSEGKLTVLVKAAA
jgi:hypothetical protein